VVIPRTNEIARFTISGVVVTIDWGSGEGPEVSLKFHNQLVINGIDGNVPTTKARSTGTTGAKIGSNGFVSGGLKGGRNPSANLNHQLSKQILCEI